MDAHELFRKLTAGVTFDKKRFHADAERFQLIRKQSQDVFKDKQEIAAGVDGVCHRLPVKRKLEDDEEQANNIDSLVLLDGILVPKDGTKVKPKKLKETTMEDRKIKQEQEKINQLRNRHRINVTGSRVPEPIINFQELSTIYNLPKQLLDNMETCGYVHPTPIQMQAMPIMLQGRQILACAPTGSGKTAAFLLPIIHQLRGPQKRGFRAIILSPTRELAKQTYRECLRLGEGIDFRVHIISKTNQVLDKYGPKSSQKFDILITTPKRIIFLLNQDPPAISLSNVEWLVVDEADKLFEDGTRSFRDQLEGISRACTNNNLRRALFSATNTPIVTKWCRHNLKGLVTVTVGHRNAATDLVDQELLFVGAERGKLVALRNIIQKGVMPPVLIFVQSKERAQELFNELIYDGINVDVIHADRTQTQRDNVVRCFREGKIWVLICTELMARGIDFKGVNLVVNYDFPPSAISYVHRIGRTGRAGRKGKAITFFTEQDTTNLRSIAAIMRASGCEIPDYMLAMKRHSKKERRKLERKAPTRDRISTLPKLGRVHETIKASRRKLSAENSKTKENKKVDYDKKRETVKDKVLKEKVQAGKKNKLNRNPIVIGEHKMIKDTRSVRINKKSVVRKKRPLMKTSKFLIDETVTTDTK